MVRIQNQYNILLKKRKTNLTIYLLINIIQIIFTASIIVLNLYLVRMNKADSQTKWIFIAIAILVAMTSAVSSYMSLMVYRKKSKILSEKQRKIIFELDKFKDKIEEYSSEFPEEILVRKVNEVLKRD